MLQLKRPTLSRETKSNLGAKPNLAKIIPTLSEQNDLLGPLIEGNIEWKSTQNSKTNSTEKNEMKTENPRLAYFARDRNNIVPNDAQRTGLRKTFDKNRMTTQSIQMPMRSAISTHQ